MNTIDYRNYGGESETKEVDACEDATRLLPPPCLRNTPSGSPAVPDSCGWGILTACPRWNPPGPHLKPQADVRAGRQGTRQPDNPAVFSQWWPSGLGLNEAAREIDIWKVHSSEKLNLECRTWRLEQGRCTQGGPAREALQGSSHQVGSFLCPTTRAPYLS